MGIGDNITGVPGDPNVGVPGDPNVGVPGDPGGGDDAPLISADGFKVLYNGSYVSIKDICRTYAGCSPEIADKFRDNEENTLVGTPYNSLDPWNTNINLPYYQGGQQLRWILKDSKPNFNDPPVSLFKLMNPIPTYYRIYISNNTLKIDYYSASSTWVAFKSYSASDFIDEVVPKRILVALQAGGGSGGNGNWNTAGSGGGGGAGWIGILNIESTVYISIGAGGEVGADIHGNPGGSSFINHESGSRAITLGGGGAGKYNAWNSNPAGGKVTLNSQYQGVLYWTLLSVKGGYGGSAGDNALGNKVDATSGGTISSHTIYSTNVNNDKTSANQKILDIQYGGKPDSSNRKKSGGGGGASLFGPGGNSYVGGYAEAGQQGAGGGGAGERDGQPQGGAGGRGICYLYLPLF